MDTFGVIITNRSCLLLLSLICSYSLTKYTHINIDTYPSSVLEDLFQAAIELYASKPLHYFSSHTRTDMVTFFFQVYSLHIKLSAAKCLSKLSMCMSTVDQRSRWCHRIDLDPRVNGWHRVCDDDRLLVFTSDASLLWATMHATIGRQELLEYYVLLQMFIINILLHNHVLGRTYAGAEGGGGKGGKHPLS